MSSIRPVEDLPEDLNNRVTEGVYALITDITATLYDAPATLAESARLPAPAQRDHHLAVLAAAEMLRERLYRLTALSAYAAGSCGGAPATYADLGAAVGIARQSARERWPEASDATPGRPKKETVDQVTVYLHGGHPQWDGQQLEMDRADVYARDLDDVGGYMKIPDGSFPDHLAAEGGGIDWRAHYAPEAESRRQVWTFQGWVPS